MFTQTKNNKMSTQIIHQFREAILRGDLQSGQALPPEKDLIVSLGVSKHTLREALRALEAMGLIAIKRGAKGGPVVQRVDMETTRNSISNFLCFKNVSVKDLADVRKVFEPYLARELAENLTEENKTKLLEVHERCLRIYDPMKHRGQTEEINFHIFMARHTGNPIMVLILDLVNNLLADFKKHLKPGPDFVQMVHRGHQEIVDAILARQPDKAEAAMRRHLEEVEEAMLELGEKSPHA